MVALLNNTTRMRPWQIWLRQKQNLTVTSRDLRADAFYVRGFPLELHSLDSDI